jgi:hypothetical protein
VSNHTPGPWHYEESPLKTGWCVVTGNNYLADVHKHVGATADDARDEANARLIAAAPELLEALEVIANIANEPHHERALTAILDIARNSSAKAKGKTNE